MPRARRRVVVVVVALAVLVGVGAWAKIRLDKMPPPVEQGQVRFYGMTRAGVPPVTVGLTHAIVGKAFFYDGGDASPYAQIDFYPTHGGPRITRVEAREGDEFAVGDLKVRVAHLWLVPNSYHRAVDLEIVSGPAK